MREAARILHIAPATASSRLKKFAERGLLKKRKERQLLLYKANLESNFYRDMKSFYNLRKIRDSGLLEDFDRFYLRPTVVLFGSAAQGMDTENSDFDFLIISENTKIFPYKDKYEKILRKPLQIFAAKSIKAIKNKHLISNMLNGIVLQGGIIWN